MCSENSAIHLAIVLTFLYVTLLERKISPLFCLQSQFPTKSGRVQLINLGYVVLGYEQNSVVFFQPKADFFGSKNKVQILAKMTEVSLKIKNQFSKQP